MPISCSLILYGKSINPNNIYEVSRLIGQRRLFQANIAFNSCIPFLENELSNSMNSNYSEAVKFWILTAILGM